MITIKPIPTPKQIYKNLYRLIRADINSYIYCKEHNVTLYDPLSFYKVTSTHIDTITHHDDCTCYGNKFCTQLRVYMYSYRHHRLGRVT